MSVNDYESLVFYLTICVLALLLLRLTWNRLYRKYPWFYAYLVASLLESVTQVLIQRYSAAAAVLRRSSPLFVNFYMIAETVRAVLVFFVVLELYQFALASQPALARYGRRVAGSVMLVAALVSASGLLFGVSGGIPSQETVQRFFTFERTVASWYCILVLLIVAFLAWFPVRMRVNVALYTGGFLFYFSMQTLQFFTLGQHSLRDSHLWDAVGMSGTLVCLLAWTAAMRQQGEALTTIVGHSWNPARITELNRQLEAINASLLRLRR
jgi:hypothetical protein